MPPLRCALALGRIALFGLSGVAGLAQGTSVEFANLHEDIAGLNQRLADLAGRVEVLENRATTPLPPSKLPRDMATTAQLNEAVADLTAQIAELKAASSKAGRTAAAADDSAAPVRAASPLKRASSAGGDFPHEGVAYIVVKGDTLALIAKKTGARFQDIVNANQITDPSHIRVGQKLFLPGGKIP